MKIAIAGGTGFIGKHLIAHLAQQQADITLISRTKQGADSQNVKRITWDELDAESGRLEGFDAIINLSGETINQRWTQAAKQRILQSRIDTTSRIAQLVAHLQKKPKAVINGSGISFYGVSETDAYNENSPLRQVDFLSGVVAQWEQAADQIKGIRVIKLRVGIVLGNDGGALPKMILPYRLGIGGRIGSGRQWLSWIHIADMVRLIEFCIANEQIEGPVNATAPDPVTNDHFGRAVGEVLHKPHWLPVPALAFKVMFGELSELLLQGQKVLPGKSIDHGFVFQFPAIKEALEELLGPKN
jgi:uncharacterized protein (TIGR01777 family)